jgi:hypothetical protein
MRVSSPKTVSRLLITQDLTHPSHYNSWRLTGLYVLCSVFFTAGFIAREMGAFDYTDLIKFIVSTCLIYAAPYALPLPPPYLDITSQIPPCTDSLPP